ncbi:MAG: hypothetical protein ACI83B_002099 [Sediminicola sp.]|jgi:hypothetical protein
MSKIISILLSVLLLLSSTGVTYAQHFCGEFEMLSKVTLGEEHLSCGMAMEVPDCDDDDYDDAEDRHCCDNEYTSVTTDDNFAKANFNIDFDKSFAIAFVSVFVLQQLVEYEASIDDYTLYYPPPLYKNIPVLYETFLI